MVHRSRNGFTLIEVLVAVLVLSIGLLGLAALQTSSLRFNQVAFSRSQATILAQSMMEYLRADRDGAESGAYDIALADAPPTSPSTMADAVVAGWRARIAETLPDRAANDASGAVSVQNNGDVTVRVAWGERGRESGQAVTDRTFVFNSSL